MVPLWHPFRFLLVALAGWINQQQRDVIDYLQEENRVLREQLGPRRLRFTNDQRIRLAAKAKSLGRRALTEIRSIVTPDTFSRVASSADRPAQPATTPHVMSGATAPAPLIGARHATSGLR